MKITYYRREVYGTTYYYITDQPLQTAWQKLTGRKTLLPSDLHHMQAFGVTFEEVIRPA